MKPDIDTVTVKVPPRGRGKNPAELVECGACGARGDLRVSDGRVHGEHCPRGLGE